MPSPHTLLAFAALSAVLVAVPGPSVLFIVGRAVAAGRRVALLTVVGNAAGVYVQVLAVAAGLGVLVTTSVVVYSIVKFVGAAYLVWLGVSAWRTAGATAGAIREQVVAEQATDPALQAVPATTSRRALVDGAVVGVSNPKVLAFFAALLPQYTTTAAGSVPVPVQVAVLGLVFVVVALALDSAWAVAAGHAREWLTTSPARLRRLRRSGAGVMVGLGVHLALTGRPE